MATRQEAFVKPELLIWARTSIGYDIPEAAHRLRVKPERLVSWEAGSIRPTVAQLRAAARVYRRPLAAFFLPEPPKDFHVPHDYRRLRGETAQKMSPEIRAEIRRVQAQRYFAVELSERDFENMRPLIGTATLADDVQSLAASAREAIGISLKEQVKWKDRYEALNAWRAALEQLGILVFQMGRVEVAEMRGFSIAEKRYPIIAANAKDSPNARIFTFLHELCHLMLDSAGLCDLEEGRRARTPDQQTEQFCNAFAGSVLVPDDALLATLKKGKPLRPREWADSALRDLANAFCVSREVILRRMLTLGWTTYTFYRRKRAQFIEEAQLRGSKSGFISPAARAIRSAGPEFVRVVMSAYDREEITGNDLSEYLGVKIRHVPKVREMAFHGSRYRAETAAQHKV